jgi:hypothetical protein
MSSSDEGIFGDAFFEPLAKFVSGGAASPTEGADVAIETDTKYMAIAVKSGINVFNAQSKRRQKQDFDALGKRMQKLQKQFDPVVGYCYGRKKQSPKSTASYRELAGQAFWAEITGDEDFYLAIVRLMKNKPQEHLPQFRAAFDAATNRFTAEFISMFCHQDGTIDWGKLVTFNSAREIPKKPKEKTPKAAIKRSLIKTT